MLRINDGKLLVEVGEVAGAVHTLALAEIQAIDVLARPAASVRDKGMLVLMGLLVTSFMVLKAIYSGYSDMS